MAIDDFEGTTPPSCRMNSSMAAAEAGVCRKAWLPEKAEHNHRRRLLGTREQALHFTEIYRFDAGHQDSVR